MQITIEPPKHYLRDNTIWIKVGDKMYIAVMCYKSYEEALKVAKQIIANVKIGE